MPAAIECDYVGCDATTDNPATFRSYRVTGLGFNSGRSTWWCSKHYPEILEWLNEQLLKKIKKPTT